MGNTSSVPMSEKEVDSGFVMITNTQKPCLSFDPKVSFILAFGIDEQTHPVYQKKSLGRTVKLDALEVTMALIKHTEISSFETYCSSDKPSCCTQYGIQEAIENAARKVKEEGIFILFFGGHGINDSDQKWAFAPADFDLTPNSYITSEVINNCIERSECKAKCVLVILDCCYSGLMASDMTSATSHLLPNIHVLAAGSAYESSLAVTSLHHSIFSYFLTKALDTLPRTAGQLPIADVHEFCRECSKALSSLILTIDNHNVKTKQIVPSLSYFNPVVNLSEDEEIDGDVMRAYIPGRLNFVIKLFSDHSPANPRPRLHPTTQTWLRSLINGPIILLESKELLGSSTENDCLLESVVALIVQSVAVLEFYHNRSTVGQPDIFLIGFIQTLAIIDVVHSNFAVGPECLLVSWALYQRILAKNNVDQTLMKELYQKITDTKV